MKISAALSFLLLAPLANAQDLDAKVTLKTTGMTVANVLAKLKEATHADLQCVPTAAREVVLVDVADVPAKDLMARLASALGAEWAKSDQMYQLLVRDTEIRKEQSARFARDAAKVRAAISKLAERAKPDEPFAVPSGGPKIIDEPGGTEVFVTQGGGTAGEKPLVKILQLISPETLARILPNARIVFATNPFGLQLPMPGAAIAQIRRAIADELKAAERGTGGRSLVKIGPNGKDESIERLRRGVYGKAYVTVRRMGWEPNFVVSLSIVDPEGEHMAGGTLFLNGNDEGGQPADTTKQDKAPLKLSDDAKSLCHLSPARSGPQQFQEILVVASAEDGFTTTSAGSPDVRAGAAADLMRDPVAHEPLSYFVGESVRQSMSADKPTVAVLSDEMFESLRGMLGGENVSLGAVRARLESEGYKFTEEDGWNIAAPEDLDRCRQTRIDRKEFKNLLEAAAAYGAAPLAVVAKYAVVSPDAGATLWDVTYANALYGATVGREVSDTRGPNRDALRLYATLPDALRLRTGRTPLTGALGSASARGDLFDLIFRSNDGPRPLSRRGQRQPRERVSVAISSSGDNPDFMPSILGSGFERTDVFASVPQQTNIVMNSSAKAVLRIYDPKTGQSQMMAPEQVGSQRAMGEQPWGGQFSKGLGPDMKVQIMSQRQVSFQFEFGGQYTMARSLSDYAPVPESKLVTWNELPQGIQDQIEASYKRSNEAYKKGAQFVSRGRGTIPPTP